MTYGYVDVILVSVAIAVCMGEQERGSKMRKESGWVVCFEEILALSP